MRQLNEQERPAMIEAYAASSFENGANTTDGFERGFAAGLDYCQGQIDDLLAALRPVAACAPVWDEAYSDHVVHWSRRGVEGQPDLGITVGDLLRAAAVIARMEGGEG